MREKYPIFRSEKLLALARESPCCFGCQAYNVGNVVSAHSNQSRDGKCMGGKGDDFRIAFLCGTCHHEIDQGSKLSRAERIAFWEDAHRETIGWLFRSGHLIVV